MKLLICVFSVILDVFLLNIINFSFNNISFYYPMLTITSLVFVSNYYNNQNRKNYYFLLLMIAVIYDSLTVSNLLITVTIFEVIGFINVKLNRYFRNNLLNAILKLVISLFVYDLLFSLLLFVVGYSMFNINNIIYKYFNSLFLNVIYLIIMFIVLKPKKA